MERTMDSREEQSDKFLSSDALSEEFFVEIIENKLKIARDKFKLRLVIVTPATGKNENFVCVVYRVKIKIQLLETNENITVDIILKALLSTLKEFKEFGVFPRERFMYENILKSLESIWLEKAGVDVQFAPKSLNFANEPYEVIVMEDLKSMGYQMLDRKVGADFEQTKLFLSKLSKFHASSAIRYLKDGVIKDYLDRKASIPKIEESHPFAKAFVLQLKAFEKSIRNYGDCDIYADKISKWDTKNMINIFIDVAKPMRSGFTILSHGDAWLNNMMFLINEEQKNPLDVIFYDFQGSSWASPASDILYFLISSASDNVKVEHFDDFIEFYHHELCKSLNKVGYDQHIPTLSELFIDIMEKGPFAVICLMNVLSIVKNDSTEEINIETLFMETDEEIVNEFYSRIYGNEIFKKAIKTWLPFLNKRGFLDTLLPTNS